MKIQDWYTQWSALGRNNNKLRLAKLLKISPSMVTKIFNGSIPGKSTMRLLVRVTGGLVQPNDFYN